MAWASPSMTASVGLPALTMMMDPPRLFQRVQELLDGLRPHEVALVAVLFEQGVGLGDRPVVQRHRVAMVGEIPGEVRPHHSQASDADLRGPRLRFLRFWGTHVSASQIANKLSDHTVAQPTPTGIPGFEPGPTLSEARHSTAGAVR